MLDDETLRDGLQSPSVRTPTHRAEDPDPAPHRRARHRHRRHRPAGRRSARGPRRRAAGPRDRLGAACRCGPTAPPAPTSTTSGPSPRSCSGPGVPIECCTFIGSSPIRQFTEGWTLDWLLRNTEEAITFAVKEGLDVMYVTEDTTRANPETLRAHLHAAPSGPAPSGSAWPTPWATPRRRAPRRWSASRRR